MSVSASGLRPEDLTPAHLAADLAPLLSSVLANSRGEVRHAVGLLKFAAIAPLYSLASREDVLKIVGQHSIEATLVRYAADLAPALTWLETHVGPFLADLPTEAQAWYHAILSLLRLPSASVSEPARVALESMTSDKATPDPSTQPSTG